ncbi:MAG: DUF4382 domain-containing protein [Chloroflexota bacterium]
MKNKPLILLAVILSVLLLAACQSAAPTGELEIRANGEDFVRQGFVSKDGWEIAFDHVYVHLTDIAAYQTDPPYNASDGNVPEGTAIELDEMFVLDLAEGDANADTILIGGSDAAPIGQFNAVSWEMSPATEGDIGGQTIQMVGSANKDGEEIAFVINVDESYGYACGEFVGDERKGFIEEGSLGDVELTFHFDHIFGDFDTDQGEAINVSAVGFDPFAALASGGQLDISYSDLEAQMSTEDFEKLANNLQTLGHVGEGHCYESTRGFTGNQ